MDRTDGGSKCSRSWLATERDGEGETERERVKRGRGCGWGRERLNRGVRESEGKGSVWGRYSEHATPDIME